jgi:hypothetical protein
MTKAHFEKFRKFLEYLLADLVDPLGRSERWHWVDV